jgi:hypothetical protein
MAQHNKVATGRRHAPVDLTAHCLRIDTAPTPDRWITSNPDDAPMMNRIERTTRLEASLAEMRDHPHEHYVWLTLPVREPCGRAEVQSPADVDDRSFWVKGTTRRTAF